MSENCETCKNQRVLYYYGEVCICADCSDDMKLSDYIKQLQEENNELKINIETKQAVIEYLEQFVEFCDQCKNPKDDCLC